VSEARITLLGGEKGGSGKTTIGVSLAAMRAGEGRDVLLVDADKQASASRWNEIRDAEKISPRLTCVSIYGDSLANQIRSLAAKYDDIVIDTRGSDAAELRSAMLVAHVIVTPAQTSQFDIFSFGTMDRLVEQARGFNPDLRALAVINRAPTNARSSDVADMREALASLAQYTLLECVISDRKAFRLTARDGLAVTEYPQADAKAVAEIRALAEEVWR
jgi:chromosome partitioning protein